MARIVTSLLSPAVPGHDRTEQGSPEPNVERALELMAGRTGSVTIAACEFPGCEAWAEELARQLGPIGISVEVRFVQDPIAEASDPASGVGIVNAFGDCGCMIPDAANAVGHLFKLVPEGWMPDSLVGQMDGLSLLADPERTDRAVSLADTLVEDRS